jgi:hypothetical protein
MLARPQRHCLPCTNARALEDKAVYRPARVVPKRVEVPQREIVHREAWVRGEVGQEAEVHLRRPCTEPVAPPPFGCTAALHYWYEWDIPGPIWHAE